MNIIATGTCMVFLTCLVVGISGQCAPYGVETGRWIVYDLAAVGGAYPIQTNAFFVCTGEMTLAGIWKHTCVGAKWTAAEGHCAYNVAEGKVTTHMSTYNQDGNAKNAVDGNANGYWWTRSCTGTQWETDPWWNVDLGRTYNVGSIHIYNRIQSDLATRLIGAEVLAGTGEDPLQNRIVMKITSFHMRFNPIIIRLNRPVTDVTIRLPGERKLLTLCEVEVYGLPA